MKHGDNMRKQYETIPHLSWTRSAHAESCKATENEMQYAVSLTADGKWLLYLKGKLIKPYDYVPSDYSTLIINGQEAKGESGSDRVGHASRYVQQQGVNGELCKPLDTLRLGQAVLLKVVHHNLPLRRGLHHQMCKGPLLLMPGKRSCYLAKCRRQRRRTLGCLTPRVSCELQGPQPHRSRRPLRRCTRTRCLQSGRAASQL